MVGICLFALVVIIRKLPNVSSERALFKVNKTLDKTTMANESLGLDWNTAEYQLLEANGRGSDSSWMILLTVNDAFFDFFLNWFWYYKKLDIHLPITIFAEDDVVYEKLNSACSVCTVWRSDLNLTEALNYRTTLYKIMVSTRPLHILRVLRNGNDVIYADVDSVWLQNPLPILNKCVDFAIQLDGPNNLCTGFMAIRSNNRTTKIIQQWYERLMKESNVNQGIFNQVMRLNKVGNVALNTLYFPNGKQYFVQYNETERARAVVVHNNWIVGHDAKKNRFQKFNLWRV